MGHSFKASMTTCSALLSIAGVFAVPAYAATSDAVTASGMTIAVTNCQDSGPGSLRDAVARAVSGDLIDLRSLGCSRILLTGGAIAIPQDNLILQGPGRAALTIDGNRASAVLRHSGNGALRVRRITVAYGYNGFDANGGCIHSQGDVVLNGSRVHQCRADGLEQINGNAHGGGVYARGDVLLVHSDVNANAAGGTDQMPFPYCYGGGVFVGGHLTVTHSRISDNRCTAYGEGGGAYVENGITTEYATINGNQAQVGSGLLSKAGSVAVSHTAIFDNYAGRGGAAGMSVSAAQGETVMIVNSTFSRNAAQSTSALSLHGQAEKSIINSTIAFNRAILEACGASAVSVTDGDGSGSVYIESSIIARNTDATNEGCVVVDIKAGEISGSNNLIMESAAESTPADTITADPQLAPLASNGGPTKSHALLCDSPAIDRGSNPAELAGDQRGAGFPRVKGASADIGAFELR
jgi:hypothetical protein